MRNAIEAISARMKIKTNARVESSASSGSTDKARTSMAPTLQVGRLGGVSGHCFERILVISGEMKTAYTDESEESLTMPLSRVTLNRVEKICKENLET
jgi:hypothetical protein